MIKKILNMIFPKPVKLEIGCSICGAPVCHVFLNEHYVYPDSVNVWIDSIRLCDDCFTIADKGAT